MTIPFVMPVLEETGTKKRSADDMPKKRVKKQKTVESDHSSSASDSEDKGSDASATETNKPDSRETQKQNAKKKDSKEKLQRTVFVGNLIRSVAEDVS